MEIFAFSIAFVSILCIALIGFKTVIDLDK